MFFSVGWFGSLCRSLKNVSSDLVIALLGIESKKILENVLQVVYKRMSQMFKLVYNKAFYNYEMFGNS